MTKSALLPLLVLIPAFGLLNPAPASSDQAQLVSCEQAEAARQRLGATVRHYCTPCGDLAFAEVKVVGARVSAAGDRCQLELDGEVVDLAYIYFQGSDGSWLNLAVELELPVENLPRSLPATLSSSTELRSFEGFYRGTIGTLPIMIELERDGRTLAGRYFYEKIGTPLSVQVDQVAGNRLHAHEQDEHRTTGRWSLDRAADGTSLRGEWRDPAGQRRLTIRLTRYATRVRIDERTEHAELHLAYPGFVDDSAALTQLNQKLDDEAEATRAELFREIAEVLAEGPVVVPWETSCTMTVSLYRPELISLLEYCYVYAGGVHGLTGYSTSTYLIDGARLRLLTLNELFQGPEAITRLARMVLADLARQKAGYVVDGEIERLTAEDLSTFSLGPSKIFFHFSPYHVGPYVAGPYLVSIPYTKLTDLIGSNSPLQQLLAKPSLPAHATR